MRVKVGVVPGKVGSYVLDEGTTVADAIRVAEINPTGYEIRVNSTPTENFNTALHDGDQVFLAEKIKGNATDFFTVNVKQEGAVTEVIPDEIAIDSKHNRVKDVLKLAGIDTDGLAVIFVNGKESNTGSFVSAGSLVTYKTKEQVEKEEAIATESRTEIVAEAPAKEEAQVFDISGMTGEIIIKTKSGEFTVKQ